MSSYYSLELSAADQDELQKWNAVEQTFVNLRGKLARRIKPNTLDGIVSRWMMRALSGAKATLGTDVEMLLRELHNHSPLSERDRGDITTIVGNLHPDRTLARREEKEKRLIDDKRYVTGGGIKIPSFRFKWLMSKGMTPSEIFMLARRYKALNSGNNQLALAPDFLDRLADDAECIPSELFASAFNMHPQTNFIGSLFPDIEYKVGSHGNFFDLTSKTLPDGFHIVNPPYDEIMMVDMMNHLNGLMENGDRSYYFLITIPVWDREGQRELGIDLGYTKFDAFDLVKYSEFTRKVYLVPKNTSRFIDYSTDQTISPCNIYVILMSNRGSDADHDGEDDDECLRRLEQTVESYFKVRPYDFLKGQSTC